MVFFIKTMHSSIGTVKSRQLSRKNYWKMLVGCMSVPIRKSDYGLTMILHSRFRLVSLQMYELQECFNQDDLESQLEGLPRSLDEVYDRIVSGLNMKHREDALRILQWLSISARPLKL